jgi:FkbM family methyltransferase
MFLSLQDPMAISSTPNADSGVSSQPRRSLILRLRSLAAAPFQLMALYIRPVWLLRTIRLVKPESLARALDRIFDPNSLRRKFNYQFRQKLVLVSAYNGSFEVDVNDHLGYRFFMNEGFDSFLLWLGARLGITGGDILLDIGANVGSVCVPFALKFGTEVIAVEASKANCAMLMRNAALNRMKLQVHCNCAVDAQTAAAKRYLEFFTNSGNMAASSMFAKWNPSVSAARLEYVRTALVDDLVGAEIGRDRLKLIKIDVEGAESIVLRGMPRLLKAGIPIAFEYRIDLMQRDLRDDGSEMVGLLRGNHDLYGVAPTAGGGYALVEFDPRRPYENALALPRDRVEEFKRKLGG